MSFIFCMVKLFIHVNWWINALRLCIQVSSFQKKAFWSNLFGGSISFWGGEGARISPPSTPLPSSVAQVLLKKAVCRSESNIKTYSNFSCIFLTDFSISSIFCWSFLFSVCLSCANMWLKIDMQWKHAYFLKMVLALSQLQRKVSFLSNCFQNLLSYFCIHAERTENKCLYR